MASGSTPDAVRELCGHPRGSSGGTPAAGGRRGRQQGDNDDAARPGRHVSRLGRHDDRPGRGSGGVSRRCGRHGIGQPAAAGVHPFAGPRAVLGGVGRAVRRWRPPARLRRPHLHRVPPGAPAPGAGDMRRLSLCAAAAASWRASSSVASRARCARPPRPRAVTPRRAGLHPDRDHLAELPLGRPGDRRRHPHGDARRQPDHQLAGPAGSRRVVVRSAPDRRHRPRPELFRRGVRGVPIRAPGMPRDGEGSDQVSPETCWTQDSNSRYQGGFPYEPTSSTSTRRRRERPS